MYIIKTTEKRATLSVYEYITLIKSYVVEAKNKKDAYNNFLKDENIVEELEDDYEENYQPLKIEEFKKTEVV